MTPTRTHPDYAPRCVANIDHADGRTDIHESSTDRVIPMIGHTMTEMRRNIMSGPSSDGHDNVRYENVVPGTTLRDGRVVATVEPCGLWVRITFTDGTTLANKWDATVYVTPDVAPTPDVTPDIDHDRALYIDAFYADARRADMDVVDYVRFVDANRRTVVWMRERDHVIANRMNVNRDHADAINENHDRAMRRRERFNVVPTDDTTRIIATWSNDTLTAWRIAYHAPTAGHHGAFNRHIDAYVRAEIERRDMVDAAHDDAIAYNAHHALTHGH